MTSGLGRPRAIADATAIPRLGRSEHVHLIRLEAGAEIASGKGAERTPSGWAVRRTKDVDLDHLEAWLPRMARREVVPMDIDLIPSSSWSASLANVLLPASWKVLRDVTSMRVGGCEECGERSNLECHELWSYDDARRVQKLMRLETLCSLCHETRHLGYASVRGRYALALGRLAAINRLDATEAKEFADAVFVRFEARSRVEWTLDLTMLSGLEMRLKRGIEASPGRMTGRVGRQAIDARVVGVRLQADGRSVVLA